jgi:hypothetical protein
MEPATFRLVAQCLNQLRHLVPPPHPVDDITIRITCTVFSFHITLISFASSRYFSCFSVIILVRLCVRDNYVYQKGVLCCLIHESYVRSVGRYCFVRNYAAIPVQLEVVILQYVIIIIIIIIIALFLELFKFMMCTFNESVTSFSLGCYDV